MGIPARVQEIRDRVSQACRRSGRSSGEVRLVAVAKTRSAEEVAAAARSGIVDIGENRVQEAEAKRPRCPEGLRWHLVGHLQRNKAKKAVALFDFIHSLDSVSLGRLLDSSAGALEKTLPVLVQVDLAGESTKFGVSEEELFPLIEALGELSRLRLEGLMVLPPYLPEPEDVRPYFRRLRELGETARERGYLKKLELSMGMSHDFEVAIEEGATMIRIGTALFGPRPTPPTATQTTER